MDALCEKAPGVLAFGQAPGRRLNSPHTDGDALARSATLMRRPRVPVEGGPNFALYIENGCFIDLPNQGLPSPFRRITVGCQSPANRPVPCPGLGRQAPPLASACMPDRAHPRQ